MTHSASANANSFLCWWGRQVLRFPRTLLLVVAVLCGISLHYTIHHLGINTDTSELLSPELPFKKNLKIFERSFPQDSETFLVVVEALTPEHTRIAARQLADRLAARSELFSSVYIADDNTFFNRQALLYLDEPALDDLATKLIDAQPFIGYLGQNFHLPGLLEIIGKALDNQDNELPTDLTPILKQLDQALTAIPTKQTYFLSWQQLLALDTIDEEQNTRQIVVAKPVFDFNAMLPTEPAMRFMRQVQRQIEASLPGVTVKITGNPAQEHEELESLGDDMLVAGSISLLLVCGSLLVGLRSFKLLLSTSIALIAGLILTFGYAALVVGHLNVLSIAFAVLYIGLGVDFSIHVCLRYRECREQHLPNTQAIHNTIEDLGFSLFLCALTTSIGFFAFIPTSYAGVSELGVISGGGMFIGFFISIIVLPALLKILPLNKVRPTRFKLIPQTLYTFPFRHKISIRIISVLLAIASAVIVTQLSFDSNPVNLRNKQSESVITFNELLRTQRDSPFVLYALVDNPIDAQRLADKLRALDTVSETITLNDMVAANQPQKLAVIDDLNLVLGTDLDQFNGQPQHTDTRRALVELQEKVDRALQSGTDNTSVDILQQLQKHIPAFIAAADQSARDNLYHKLDDSILALLPFTMEQLRQGLSAYPFGLDDLPEYIRRQWLSQQGVYKILILPEQDLNNKDSLKAFVTEVQNVDNSVTGYPVVDMASGTAVVEAFIQALAGALAVIFLILLLILRNVRNTLLVFGPLLLAALMTGAMNVLLDNHFNFANIIAIPLLLGMGVDSGIHIMHRLHVGLTGNEQILQTSTARGVFFSSLTTLFSFTSLAFIPHDGIASMGLLLAIGISFTLLCTLIVLPAFSSKDAHY